MGFDKAAFMRAREYNPNPSDPNASRERTPGTPHTVKKPGDSVVTSTGVVRV